MSAFNVDEGVIPSAAADERGVRDSTAVATQAETDEQRAKVLAAGDTPDAPPTLSRHAVEAPSQMPFVHSRLDFAPFAASAHEGVDDRESFMSDFTGRNACHPCSRPNSDEEIATCQGNDGSVVFAIRGTATSGDAKTDAIILAGNPLTTPRFRRNTQMIDRIATTLGTAWT